MASVQRPHERAGAVPPQGMLPEQAAGVMQQGTGATLCIASRAATLPSALPQHPTTTLPPLVAPHRTMRYHQME